MRKKESRNGVSLITLVISIAVIIIIAAIGYSMSNNALNDAVSAKFMQEISDVKKGVDVVRLANSKQGLSEEDINGVFKKVKVENVPSNFVSFDLDENTAYLVDLDIIDYNKLKTGQEYKVIKEGDTVTFGIEDAFIYDRLGTVYYLKGAYLAGSGVVYSVDNEKADGPEVTAENPSGGKIVIKVRPRNNGEISSVTVGGKEATKKADGEYEIEVETNGKYTILATEIGTGTTQTSVNVTRIGSSISDNTATPTKGSIIINDGERYTTNSEAVLKITTDAELMFIKQVNDDTYPSVPKASDMGWRRSAETSKLILRGRYE